MAAKNIYGLTVKNLENYFIGLGENPAKAKIVFKAVYRDKISDFSQILSLSKKTTDMLSRDFEIRLPMLAAKTETNDACKYLFRLSDGHTVESVLMKHSYGNGVCVSTQVGCNMDCAFCESGKLKKIRNLTSDEITGQVVYIKDVLNTDISHVVLMGIGEPLDNYENVIDFIDTVTDPLGIAVAPRHITVSTSGIISKIDELSKRSSKNSLAVSLHAPNDEIRSMIMPVNKKYPVAELIGSVKRYIANGGKKVTFAYVMIDQINDSEKCAHDLAKLLDGINCCVNLIPYNRTSSQNFRKSTKENTAKFFDILKQHGINVTVRREFGADMQAACGQLRADYIKNGTAAK